MPALRSSLFLAGRPILADLILSAWIAWYSSFGIVKLSRTILLFLALTTSVWLEVEGEAVFLTGGLAGF